MLRRGAVPQALIGILSDTHRRFQRLKIAQCATELVGRPQKSPTLRGRSRVGDSKNSLIIANAAAMGDCGVAASKLPPSCMDEGDFVITLSNAPGLISPIGVGEGTSQQSSNNTRPPVGAVPVSSSSSSSSSTIARIARTLMLSSFSRSLISISSTLARFFPRPAAVVVVVVVVVSLADPRPRVGVPPTLAAGVFTPGVFPPTDGRPFTGFNGFDPFTLAPDCRRPPPRPFPLCVVGFTFEFIGITSALGVFLLVVETKFSTHRPHPRSEYRHLEHPMASFGTDGRRRRRVPTRAGRPDFKFLAIRPGDIRGCCFCVVIQ